MPGIVKVYSASFETLDLNLSTPSGTPFFLINSTLCPLSIDFQKTVSPTSILTISLLKTILLFSPLFNISIVVSSANTECENNKPNIIMKNFINITSYFLN